MKADTFYKADFTKTYSQSLMFYYYLMNKHSDIMKRLFNKINSGEINSNHLLINYLTLKTKLTVDQLDINYREYTNKKNFLMLSNSEYKKCPM